MRRRDKARPPDTPSVATPEWERVVPPADEKLVNHGLPTSDISANAAAVILGALPFHIPTPS